MSSSSSSSSSPQQPTGDMNLRMTAVLQHKGNQICADCPARRPLWASFLVSPIEEDKQFGVFCCASCAQHHHFELGEKRTMIKYLKMAHECKFCGLVDYIYIYIIGHFLGLNSAKVNDWNRCYMYLFWSLFFCFFLLTSWTDDPGIPFKLSCPFLNELPSV